MKRWHQDRKIAAREQRVHQHLAHDNQPTGCPCDRQVGRFRKKRSLDCGRARCGMCHYEKIHDITPHCQRVADLRFREQLHENE